MEEYCKTPFVNTLCPANLRFSACMTLEPGQSLYLYSLPVSGYDREKNNVSHFFFSEEWFEEDDEETVLWEVDIYVSGVLLTFLYTSQSTAEMARLCSKRTEVGSIVKGAIVGTYDTVWNSDGGWTHAELEWCGRSALRFPFYLVQVFTRFPHVPCCLGVEAPDKFRVGTQIWEVVVMVLGFSMWFIFLDHMEASLFSMMSAENSLAPPSFNYLVGVEEWFETEETLPVQRVVNPWGTRTRTPLTDGRCVMSFGSSTSSVGAIGHKDNDIIGGSSHTVNVVGLLSKLMNTVLDAEEEWLA